MKTRIATSLYGIAAILTLGMGALYLAYPRLLPYHLDALGTSWDAIAPGYQKLFLALLKAVGAGYLATGLALAFMTRALARGEAWTRWALPLVTLAGMGPLFGITLYVAARTPADPPWIFPATVLSLALAACILSPPWKKDDA